MEHILQRVIGLKRISMIDGFSSYNPIFVHLDEREMITFTTPWGTFMYSKMSFGWMNTYICFVGEKDQFVVIYLDDSIVFSKFD